MPLSSQTFLRKREGKGSGLTPQTIVDWEGLDMARFSAIINYQETFFKGSVHVKGVTHVMYPLVLCGMGVGV